MQAVLDFYRQHSTSTDPGEHADLLRNLPTDLPDLHQIVQNILIHNWKIRAYHRELLHGRDLTLATMRELLARVREQDARPLTEERPLEQKLIVDCRHFAGVLCALLRQEGIPARTRCGFGVYLEKHWAQDHYVTEYWNGSRWVLEDADVLMHDIARDQFVTAGQAWRDSRAGNDDPMRFACGPDIRGYGMIRYNLIRDLAQLNKHEEMSLASWGLGIVAEEALTPDDYGVLDAAAAHTLSDNEGFSAMQDFYCQHEHLRVPTEVNIHNYINDERTKRPSLYPCNDK
jgi:hypothetical protein